MNKFKVVALISSYNEGDVIFHVIGDLISNGISVYLIDNNSTDNTREEAAKWLHKGLINIEIFPDLRNHTHNTKDEYNWRSILGRKEILANTLEADWFIHADSDEFREAPWFETTLYEGVRKVDRLGYNTINFELLNFRPINNTFIEGEDVRKYLTLYESPQYFDLKQVKAWKNTGVKVDLISSGGHKVRFNGVRLFPLNFILRHYPIRSEQHGYKKIFKDRVPRFNKEEKDMTWHMQYDSFIDGKAKYLSAKSDLIEYDPIKIRINLLETCSNDLTLFYSICSTKFLDDILKPENIYSYVNERLDSNYKNNLEFIAIGYKAYAELLNNYILTKKDIDINIDKKTLLIMYHINELLLLHSKLNCNAEIVIAAKHLESKISQFL